MAERLLATHTASISELKMNPMAVANSAFGEPIAILNRNKVAFYCVPTEKFEEILDQLEDIELLEASRAAMSEETVSVDLKELSQKIKNKSA